MSQTKPILDSKQAIEQASSRHNFSVDAVEKAFRAILSGGGTMAQFSHPELGGMCQWTRGGMIMIGEMGNDQLKNRVQALCNDLGDAVAGSNVERDGAQQRSENEEKHEAFAQDNVSHRVGDSIFDQKKNNWWPENIGNPSSTGMQNNVGYACFPEAHRLALLENNRVTVFDTAEHEITSFAQQQSSDQTFTFNSNQGLVRTDQLKVIDSYTKSS